MDSAKPREPVLARKTHRKSRLGCLECKRRRVKCDETKPACKNCTRRSTSCSFLDGDEPSPHRGRHRPSPLPEHNAPTDSTSASGWQSPAPPNGEPVNPLTLPSHRPHLSPHDSDSQQQPPYAFDLFDLELWNHYLSTVCITLTDHPEGLFMWRDRIPKIAHRNAYTAQLLLAFSALHLCRFDDSRRPAALIKSAALQSAAINGMMVALNEHDPENVGSLWVAAMMLCFCSFGKGPQPGQYLVSSEGAEPEWLGLLQGVKSILSQNPDAIANALPNLPVEEDDFTAVSPEEIHPGLYKQLKDLQESIDALKAEDPSSDKCTLPITELNNCFSGVFVRRKGDSEITFRTFQVFAWLYRLEQDYLTSLQEQRPMALVILMHYLVLMAQLKGTWYLEGWVEHIKEAIKAHLHPAYGRWLEWPLHALEVARSTEIGIYVSTQFRQEYSEPDRMRRAV